MEMGNNGQRLDKLKNSQSGGKHKIEVFKDGSIAEVKEAPGMRAVFVDGELGAPVRTVEVDKSMASNLSRRVLRNVAYDLDNNELITKAELENRKGKVS